MGEEKPIKMPGNLWGQLEETVGWGCSQDVTRVAGHQGRCSVSFPHLSPSNPGGWILPAGETKGQNRQATCLRSHSQEMVKKQVLLQCTAPWPGRDDQEHTEDGVPRMLKNTKWIMLFLGLKLSHRRRCSRDRAQSPEPTVWVLGPATPLAPGGTMLHDSGFQPQGLV